MNPNSNIKHLKTTFLRFFWWWWVTVFAVLLSCDFENSDYKSIVVLVLFASLNLYIAVAASRTQKTKPKNE